MNEYSLSGHTALDGLKLPVCKEFSEATVARAALDRIAVPSGLPSSTDCTSTSSFQSRGMDVRCGPCLLKRRGE